MKIKTEKEFTPVTISITFESEDELLDYWHRLNVPKSVVFENASQSRVRLPNCLCSKDVLRKVINKALRVDQF